MVKPVLLTAFLFPFLLSAQTEDVRRITLTYQTGANPDHFDRLAIYELGVGLKFKNFWGESFIASLGGNFDAVASNADSLASPSSEGYFRRTGETSFKSLQMGMGLGMESAWVNETLETTSFYERAKTFLTYMSVKDSFRPRERYSGVGFRADYGIHYRYSSFYHLGFGFSYRFSPVRRSPKFAGENSSERSLLFASFSAGVDFSLFF